MSVLNLYGWIVSGVHVYVAAEEVSLFGSGFVVEYLDMPIHHQHITLRIAHMAEADVSQG
jgi:hypothetical protein